MAKLIKFSNPVVNFEGLICLDFNQHFLSVYNVEAGREGGEFVVMRYVHSHALEIIDDNKVVGIIGF